MQGYFTLTRRELGAYFLSVTGYIIIAAAMFLMGFSFVVLLVKLQRDPKKVVIVTDIGCIGLADRSAWGKGNAKEAMILALRLALGIEDAQDLIADLDQALKNV